MGSYVELNDTLQITKEQGFPEELDWKQHLKNPYPVRNFLVENIDGKWLYWGQIHMLEVKHDYINKTTSGKFKIIYINKPEEMEMAHNLIDRNKETFFSLKD